MKNLVTLLFLCMVPVFAFSQSNAVPKPVASYSPSRMTSCGMLYISGQIPVNPETGLLLKGDIKAETRQVMKNIDAVLKANDMDFSNVVKCTVFLTDIRDYADVNGVYGSYFNDIFPAREAVEVSNLPLGASIEISAIAYR